MFLQLYEPVVVINFCHLEKLQNTRGKATSIEELPPFINKNIEKPQSHLIK